MLATGLALLATPLIGQQAQSNAPAFEVATVKPHDTSDNRTGVFPKPGRLTVRNYTIRRLIQDSYNVKNYQILGGPAWIDQDAFDVDAKTEERADFGQMMATLQGLLAERFQLKLHRETRELPVYILVVDKKSPKLTRSRADDPTPAGVRVVDGSMTGTKMSLPWFADALAAQLNLTVLDQTGLKGDFDFKLEWASENPPPALREDDSTAPDAGQPLIFTAIRQLGLRIEVRKGPVEVLIIDHVERPSGN